jgi:hypothetical protein
VITSNGYVLDESPARWGELVRTPDRERTDRPALWRRLRAQGYLYLPGLLDVEVVTAFRTYYFEALRGTGLWDESRPAGDAVAALTPVDQARLRHQLFRVVVPSAAYERFCLQPALSGWFGWFLDDEVHLHRRKILRHTRPGESGVGTATQAHYDLVYLREGTDRLLSAWIPLGDCPVEIGGLTYLEGSHRRVLAEEAAGVHRRAAWMTADLPGMAETYDTRWLTADFAAGDVMVHSAHVIHAATDNVAADHTMRLSTDIRYQRRRDPIDWRWQHDWDPDDGL